MFLNLEGKTEGEKILEYSDWFIWAGVVKELSVTRVILRLDSITVNGQTEVSTMEKCQEPKATFHLFL